MRLRAYEVVLAAATLTGVALAPPAAAQPALGGIALDQLEPAPAGDDLFTVASPAVRGHLVPRAFAMVDFASDPLVLSNGGGDVVSSQTFLRIDASLSLFDRLLVTADLPFAIAQSGDGPVVQGVTIRSPSSAELGDLRLGARVGLLGAPRAPFQLGFGAYLFVPTAAGDSYAGEGAVRVRPELLAGGHLDGPVGLVWGASGGLSLRASDNPSAMTFGAGAALVLGEGFFQIGPELTGAVGLGGDAPLSTDTITVDPGSTANAELLLGAKLRVLGSFVLGAGAGPGLTSAIGTPSFRAVGMLAYAPQVSREAARDGDGDGVPDAKDACPAQPGDRSDEPRRHGCPPPDRDSDGVADAKDACPELPGGASADPKLDGCPPDRDGDAVPDIIDACPDEKGVRAADPLRSGCPLAQAPDTDADSIADLEDACPSAPGPRTNDPLTRGCPIANDRDGDGIVDADDVCPNEKGAASADAKQNGCPREVRVTNEEIVILRQVQFTSGGAGIGDTIDPVSDDLLTEVRDVIHQHPEITKIEVQGHTDSVGVGPTNLGLSQARADSVRRWLVQRGIPAAKLTAKGYGASLPLAENTTPEGRQKNRRVQFVILGKKK